ncbi:MAG TPA: sensor histidine kinase [Chthoniobacterales bacterium]|nr:sensor histidine kinase [Chthoniobacterales bacterium]
MLTRIVFFLLACDLALTTAAAERPQGTSAGEVRLLQSERSALPAIQAADLALARPLDRQAYYRWVAALNPLPSYLASIWEERRGLIIAVLAIVAVQSALIAGLLVYHAALRRAKGEGQEAHLEMRRLQNEIAHVGRVSMMGQLASSLAHEINQPLGAILRNAEAAELFLESKNPDLEEIRAILADIRADDQRAGSVIDRMRSLLKRHVLETQLLDLSEVVGDVAQLARPDAASRRVALTVEVPDILPPVRGDRVHLQQVLLNLIVNGMDALNGSSPENRSVTVRARVDAAQGVEISVSDTGHGIAAAKLSQVFDPFYTTKADGMGMGLPISRTIVESHGGRLWAENNNNTGATFRFTLPLADGARGGGRGARDGV